MRMAARLRKGGRQPSDSNEGNRKFPKIEPVRPNIISNETTIVLNTRRIHFSYQYLFTTLPSSPQPKHPEDITGAVWEQE